MSHPIHNLSLALFPFIFFVFSGCNHIPSQDNAGVRNSLALSGSEREAGSIEVQSNQLREQGISFYQKGECARAINPLEAAFLLTPNANETRSKYILYYCYLSSGDYKKALTVAEYLLRAQPYQSLSYLQLGMAQLWLGKIDAAILSLTRASDIETHSPKTHFYLGIAYGFKKNPAAKEKAFLEAEKEYLSILAKSPKDLSANYELAQLWLYWNRSIDKVAPLISLARASNPDPLLYEQYYFPLLEGILSYRNGDAKHALPSLLSAFTHVPSGFKAELAEIYYYMGQSHRIIGNRESAKILLEQSISTDPKGPYCEESRKAIKGLKG